jgi:hypothetical protein
MTCEYNNTCGTCTSDGVCEKRFAQRVVTYQQKYLIPALAAMDGLHMLHSEARSSDGLDSQL